MKRAIVFGLLAITACAPQREDFAEVCQAEETAKPIPPRVAAVLTSEESRASYLRSNVYACQSLRHGLARSAHQARWAPAVAIVLGSASDALATHNFYVYRVPEARRYLERNR